MKTPYLLVLLFALSARAFAADPVVPTCPVPCTVLRVHDGDTIKVDLRLPFRLTLRDVTIRAYGYDCFEIDRTRRTVNVTDVEIERGKAAKDDLIILLSDGRGSFDDWKLYAEDTGTVDPYGRISAVLWVKDGSNWIYLARYMEEHQHLRTPRTP